MLKALPMWTDATGEVWVGLPLATYTALTQRGVEVAVAGYEQRLSDAERIIARLIATIESMGPHLRVRAAREAVEAAEVSG